MHQYNFTDKSSPLLVEQYRTTKMYAQHHSIITRVESTIPVPVLPAFLRFGLGRRFERRLGCLLSPASLEVPRGELDVDWTEEAPLELDELTVLAMTEAG